METEKLFYESSYLRTFTAKVLECSKQDEHYAVVLNRTAFFPEGGGQPADIGVLNTVNVLDVQEHEGKIVHTTDRPLPVGMSVTGGINWPHRFDLMQQHSGEHIVSGIVHRLFGLENVGFHMGTKAVTVDFNGEISEDGLVLVESLSNTAVYRNLPIFAEYPSPEKLDLLEYRCKKELSGKIRIVTVPEYDVCACCGTHVARTGEVGAIKLLSSQRYKGGTRVTLMIGGRALADYNEKAQSVNAVSVLLSAKPEEILAATQRLLAENSTQKQQINSLQEQIFEAKASALDKDAKNVCLFENDLGPNELRKFCLLLSGKCSGVAAVFSGSGQAGYKYALASAYEDVRPIGKELNQKFSGRGGGSKELVQGSLAAAQEELEQFFD
jgi:Predicted metal-dependent hydrolases related to alanyl-tRNA synthetase HxxxH domain